MKKVKTSIKYVGGKGRMVPKIRSIIPKNSTVLVEPFAGSGAVSINCTQFHKVVLNDVDYFIVNFLKTVSDNEKGAHLLKVLQSMPMTREAFQQALKRRKTHGSLGIDDVHLAAETWFLFNFSFNGRGATFSEPVIPDKIKEWKQNKLKELKLVVKNMASRNIEVQHHSAQWLLQGSEFLNNPNCFIYLDPPYIAGTRSPAKLYRRDLPDITAHIDLLKTIRNAKAKCVISGYDSTVYDQYLLKYRWYKYSLGRYCKSCDTTAGKSMGEEIIWTNYCLGDNSPNGIIECK